MSPIPAHPQQTVNMQPKSPQIVSPPSTFQNPDRFWRLVERKDSGLDEVE